MADRCPSTMPRANSGRRTRLEPRQPGDVLSAQVRRGGGDRAVGQEQVDPRAAAKTMMGPAKRSPPRTRGTGADICLACSGSARVGGANSTPVPLGLPARVGTVALSGASEGKRRARADVEIRSP